MADLSFRELDIQRAVMARLEADREGYLDLYDVEFGGTGEYSADNAAELFPEYSESTESRTLNREAVGKARRGSRMRRYCGGWTSRETRLL